MKLLVNAGANVNVPNFQRESPVDIALQVVDEEGRKEPRDVARLLNYRSIVAALDIRLPEERLEEAVINENLDEVRNILQQGGVVDINWRNNDYTLLM
ncbi:MAG: hypothetical protein LBD60_01575 [Puniceicoccales bacterium]|nr:hypothetical protein [Puniceicoccales bacterium]